MDKQELKKKFLSIVGGSNFCTPESNDYIEKGDYIIELSYSFSSFCGHAFGVTIVNNSKKERCLNLDTCFFGDKKEKARQKALEYINTLI